MGRLGVGSGLVTAEPELVPQRLTLKLQVALDQQHAC